MNPVKVDVDNVLRRSGERIEKTSNSSWVAGRIVGTGKDTPFLSKCASETNTFAA